MITVVGFGELVETALRDFLDEQRKAAAHPLAEDLIDFVSSLVLSGGKRLRPALCHLGWQGAGGETGPPIVAAASALELLHTFALIHDDIMDQGETRRGQLCVHRRAGDIHRRNRWHGDSVDFGQSVALLAGDLAYGWADQLLVDSGLPADRVIEAHRLFSALRTELVAGQYLDLLNSATWQAAVEPRVVNRLKTSLYTVVRPLQLGATLYGAPAGLIEGFARFGKPLGDAFQLRDDVLGLFGDPQVTGKPVLDDLRNGKRTLLVLLALAHADVTGRERLTAILGDPQADDSDAAEAQAIVAGCGALAQVEQSIAALAAEAVSTLDCLPIDADTRSALNALCDRLAYRDH